MNQNNFYSKAARWYDANLALNGYRRAVNYIVRKLPFEKGTPLNFLDAGCGTGLYTLALVRYFPNARAFAFDLNADMVSIAKHNIRRAGMSQRIHVDIAGVTDILPYQEKSFDLIVTGGVLEHTDIREGVKNLTRYVKPGGIFLNSPVKNNWIGKAVGKQAGFIPYSKELTMKAFEEEKFKFENEVRIPWIFFPISVIKDVHIFRKSNRV